MIAAFFHDVRIALRSLSAARWAAAAAVLTLALGTGVNTSVLAVAYGVLFRPLPYADPARVVVLTEEFQGTELGMPLEEFDAWRDRLRTVEHLAAYAMDQFTVRGAGDPRVVRTALVKGDFFEILGVPAARGRAGGSDTEGWAVASDRLAADLGVPAADVLGRGVAIGRGSYTVTGVMPRSFAFPGEEAALWVAASSATAIQGFSGRTDARSYQLMARLKAGVTLAQARDDATRVLREIRKEKDRAGSARVTPLTDLLTARMRPLLAILSAAAVLVLLVACANVATLLVGRALAHSHDLAVRLALGATRPQLVRAVIAESLVLAVAASALGIGISIVCLRLFAGVARGIVPRLQDVAVDLPVVAITACVAVIVTLLCGLAPALHAARGDFAPVFRGTGATASRAARRVRATLVAAQIALSVVLLVGAGLVIRTVVRLLEQDVGIEPRRAVAARLVMSDATTFSAAERLPFVNGVLARVRALPGVQAAGIGTALPPRTAPLQMGVRVVLNGKGEFKVLSLSSATPGYFAALGARLVRGRVFEERDLAGAEAVAILSESAARHLSPTREIVGRQLPFALPSPAGPSRKAMVVGVVRDIKYGGLDAPAPGAIYVPWTDLPAGVSHLVVRSAKSPASLAPALRQIVRDLDPDVPVPDIRSIGEEMANSIADRRLRLFPAVGFAVLAFTVALVGLSATVTRGVAERRRELALRGALGASPQRNLRLILSHAARITAAGVAVGLGVSAALGRTLAGILYGVTPYDPLTFAGVGALVAVAALGICYLAAKRALAVDLLQLLRSE